jgi:diguanylate cyclase (GGDEF)-like protein
MEDIRYSEFLFLQGVADAQTNKFWVNDPAQLKRLGIVNGNHYLQLVIGALEDRHIACTDDAIQRLTRRMRGELTDSHPPGSINLHYWIDPFYGLTSMLQSSVIHTMEITYRGLQRIEDLREILRRDRILEFFGVLLDLRYFRPDLMRAFQRSTDTPVAVLYADMDNFGKINKEFGQAAGDVVMKAYLEAVRDGLAQFGDGYRSLGDETVSLIVGQEHKRSVELAEGIRSRVAAMQCEYKGKALPKVSASIGVATTPPEGRTADIIDIAEERKRKAKAAGKNRVIAN